MHTPEYAIEASLLGAFMLSACVFGSLLEHPGSLLRKRLSRPLPRRALMGLAMGLTAVGLIYSPWGQRSGAHMNPAVTISFLWLGKIDPADAVFYVFAQCLGGMAGVLLSWALLRGRLAHPAVNFVVTTPGERGPRAAWIAEFLIAALMMWTVLAAGNRAALAGYTGLLAGLLVALYITWEAPLSGMSLNPARTLASALPSRCWKGIPIYLTAPVLGMLAVAVLYPRLPGAHPIHCAKLQHNRGGGCIFHCTHERLVAPTPPATAPAAADAAGWRMTWQARMLTT
jgi:aquaporin Z